jgi:nucleoside-diphosphate-sugar epimerase
MTGTVLVTGATGFIGSALVPRLVRAGYVPRLLVRCPLAQQPASPVEVVVGDVSDPAALRAAARDAVAIIHLAAATSGGRLDPATAYRVNVGSASALVEAVRGSGVRLIVISTQHVYLRAPGLYGRTKRMADRILLESGVPVTILRPSLVYGPGSRGVFVRLATLVRKLPVIPVIGPGQWRLRPLFLDDLLDVIVDVLARPELAGRTYDVGGPDLVTYDELLAAICAAIGRRCRTVHLPLGVSYALAWTLERILPSPPLTTDNVRGAQRDAHCDLRALERDLGRRLTPLAEGLRRIWPRASHA